MRSLAFTATQIFLWHYITSVDAFNSPPSRHPSLYNMAKSSNELLQDEILNGAALKIQAKKDGNSSSNSTLEIIHHVSLHESDVQHVDFNCTYYVREAKKSEIDEITQVLMNSFHPESQSLFDSYIRRYKYNHLQMCFQSNNYGMFVACSETRDTFQSCDDIVGFCCVDGEPNDPSSRVEFLTQSTLATTCPRPYLSDLGVLPSHRRKGIGQALVRKCEAWALSLGHDTMYLKVDETNKGTMKLYKGMAYKKSILPGVGVNSSGKKWGNDVLLEKKIGGVIKEENKKKRKIRWINKFWRRRERM